MILDSNLIFSENQAITATAISTNVLLMPTNGIPYGEVAAITRNLGDGTPIPFLIQVTASFATLTSLTITLEGADNAALSTNAVVYASSGAIPLATLVRGHRPTFTRWFPTGMIKDYFGIRYTVGGSNATAGTITAALGTPVQSA